MFGAVMPSEPGVSFMKIRRMGPEDISAVAAIEREAFARPWSEEILYRDLTEHSRAYIYVAEDAGEVIGHAGIWKSPDDVHLTTLAVTATRRREGVASALVEKILQEHLEDRDEVVLEVRESNQAALELYRKLGFEVRERRLQYYVDNAEDALVMVYNRDRDEKELANGTSGTNPGGS